MSDQDNELAPPTKTESGILITTVPKVERESDDFKQKVVDKYNWYLNHGGGRLNGRVLIYDVPGFQGDWSRVDPVDYFTYRMSVKGVEPTDGSSSVTVGQYDEMNASDSKTIDSRKVEINNVVNLFGPEGVSFEPNNIIMVGEKRLRELVSNAHSPAAGAFMSGDHSGVLMNTESRADPADFQAYLTHELVHFVRNKSGLNDAGGNPVARRLEEGIVQAEARRKAELGGFADARALSIYDDETSVVNSLEKALGLGSLSGLSHHSLAEIMKNDPNLSRKSPDPYQFIVDSL